MFLLLRLFLCLVEVIATVLVLISRCLFLLLLKCLFSELICTVASENGLIILRLSITNVFEDVVW